MVDDIGCEGCGTRLERSSTGRPRRWCSDRCRKAQKAGWEPPELDGEPGPISEALNSLIDATHYVDEDPRAVLAVVALRLAEALDRAPGNVAIARELRAHVRELSQFSDEPAGLIEELRVRHFARRADYLLEAATEASE
jgi:hypothetical protein